MKYSEDGIFPGIPGCSGDRPERSRRKSEESMEWNREKIRRIRCFGDSLTAGWGVPPGRGWVALLAGRMKGVSFCNCGMPGAGLSDIFSAAALQAPAFTEGDGLFFMGGTNDILCGVRLSAVEKLFEKEIRKYAAQRPVTLGIPPLTTRESINTGWQCEFAFASNQRDLAVYGDFLQTLGEELSLPVLDCRKIIDREELYGDGLHPNEAGYLKIADYGEKLWRQKKD